MGFSGRRTQDGSRKRSLPAESAADLEALPIRVKGKLLKLGDLARVRQAPDIRRGMADLDGEGECVGGIVIASKGVNALALVNRIKAKLDSLKGAACPPASRNWPRPMTART